MENRSLQSGGIWEALLKKKWNRNVLVFSVSTWNLSFPLSIPQRNLFLFIFLYFLSLPHLSVYTIYWLLGQREDAQKWNCLKICFIEWILSSRCAKLIRSSLREQSNGNGNLSSLKMKLIFSLKSLKMFQKQKCESLFHCIWTNSGRCSQPPAVTLYLHFYWA